MFRVNLCVVLLVGIAVAMTAGQVSIAMAANPIQQTKSPNEPKVPVKIEQGFAEIRNPKSLGVTRIPVERVYLGKYYKPSIARLANDELRIVGAGCLPNKDCTNNEHPIFRSTDGGRTWSKLTAMVSRLETCLLTLSDGTLMATAVENPYIYRSNDGGLTWTIPPKTATASSGGWFTTRNVLELADESLMAGIAQHKLNGKNVIR